MNYNRLFDQRLSIFKGFIKYIKDPDYHGKIIISNSSGTSYRPRDDCSNENIDLILRCVKTLMKIQTNMPPDKWKARVVRDTSAQIQFLGQCLLDRFYAKNTEMILFFEKYTAKPTGTDISKNLLLRLVNLVSHEYPLKITLEAMIHSMRLRQAAGPGRGWEDLQASFIVASRFRMMILDDGITTLTRGSKLLQLRNDAKLRNIIIKRYSELMRSKRWRQLIESIELAKRNAHSSERSEMILHKQRMTNLLKTATSIKSQF
jgi:hypothetical protein